MSVYVCVSTLYAFKMPISFALLVSDDEIMFCQPFILHVISLAKDISGKKSTFQNAVFNCLAESELQGQATAFANGLPHLSR